MKVIQSGLIIKSRRKKECVAFYKEILQLDVLFENDVLTCFACGSSYLMVEPCPDGITNQNTETILLRLNVENVLEQEAHLKRHQVTAYYEKFDWGEILTFYDPAGTKVELTGC